MTQQKPTRGAGGAEGNGSATGGLVLIPYSGAWSYFTSGDTGGSWSARNIDLSSLVGETINGFWPVVTSSPAGSWTQALADVTIVSTDGTVTPLYWGQGLTINVQDSCGGMASTFASGPAALDGPASTLSTTWYAADHLGSARMELAGGGWPLSSEAYAPFGRDITQQPTANHYKFTGKERDAESGLDYFGARYYGSSMGRFMSPDWSAKQEPVPYSKLDNPQTLNLYQYMRNNPLSGADPDGHCDWCQKLLNGITGNGFQTNAELADQRTLQGLQNGTVTTTTTYTPIVSNESSEPNKPVALGADVAAGVAAATDSAKLGGVAAGVSVLNDPSPQNVSMNALSLVPIPEVGQAVAATTLVMDAGKVAGDFIKDVGLTPMLNSLPPQNINDGSGHMIPNPALQDPTDLRPQ